MPWKHEINLFRFYFRFVDELMTFLVLKLSPCRRSRHPQTWPGTVIWCLGLKLRIAQCSELILAELITIWSPANLNLIMGAGSCKFKQDTTHCPECLSCLFTATLFALRITSYIYWSIQQMEQEIKLGTTKIPLFHSGPNISWRQLTSDFN